MGNLKQSMTQEEWDNLGKQSNEKKQSSMKYTIDTQNKTITIEQCSVSELTDLLNKLKQVHPDIHMYNVVSKIVKDPSPFSPTVVPHYNHPMRYEDMFQVYCTTTSGTTVNSGTNRVESKL
jgi:hypothetical protein